MSEKTQEVQNVLVISPKVKTKKVFLYTGLEDLKNLIEFVGTCPVIQSDTTLKFKKVEVNPGVCIEVNAFGEVINVLTQDQVKANYTLEASAQFNPATDSNKVVPKPSKVKK